MCFSIACVRSLALCVTTRRRKTKRTPAFTRVALSRTNGLFETCCCLEKKIKYVFATWATRLWGCLLCKIKCLDKFEWKGSSLFRRRMTKHSTATFSWKGPTFTVAMIMYLWPVPRDEGGSPSFHWDVSQVSDNTLPRASNIKRRSQTSGKPQAYILFLTAVQRKEKRKVCVLKRALSCQNPSKKSKRYFDIDNLFRRQINDRRYLGADVTLSN